MGDKLDHALALLKARATQLGSDEPEESVTVKGSELLFLHATITSLREALVSAREWLPCIEPVMFDTPIFKRDLEKIDAALNPSRKETGI